jgi:hypothetical protein
MARPNWQSITERLNRTMAPVVFLRTLGILLGVTLVGIVMLVFAIPSPTKISKVILSDTTAGHLELLADAEAPPLAQASDKPPETHVEKSPAPDNPQPQIEAHNESEGTPHEAAQVEPEHTSDNPPEHTEVATQEVIDADAPVRSDVEDAIAGLYETTSYGPLPIKRLTDNKTVFELYRPPFERRPDSSGLIALVMVDYGLSDKLSAKAITTLPSAISMTVSPYSRMMQPKVTGARAYGHEVWLQIPIQDINFGQDDPAR